MATGRLRDRYRLAGDLPSKAIPRADASTEDSGLGFVMPIYTRFFPDSTRLRVYAYWAGLAGVAFFAVYPTLNWLTSLRSNRFHLYISSELGIPFVPQFIWAYLSMYVLFLLPVFLLPAPRMPALGK